MEIEFTAVDAKTMRFRRVFFPIAILLAAVAFVFAPLQSASSQSGRGPQPDPKVRKPNKPKNPDPPPKIRLPENVPEPKESEDTIRINSDLVNVVVTIGGRPTNASLDLKPEDFEILEDGAPQEISNFSRNADQPLKMVMLYDTSFSVNQRINFERRAAAHFFERVIRPQDRAAVFSVSTDVVVLQELTNKIPLLVDATRQLRAQGATSLYDAIYLAADYLKYAQGRRVIVIVSDGGDTTSNKGLLEALAQAQKSDSVIFAVFTGNPWPSENLRDLAAERALEALTRETGGELFKQRLPDGRRPGEESDEASLRELDRTFADLADRLRTQYVLGFYSTNEKRDGSFRKLDVRIKKTNYVARARTGYYAPKE
ncbi:MAG TPA: VWA domain-containing protein [Blastocatellia bacterium]|jgi:Ca-activated chloride channel family protein|nr:VWA domain-containing protein [Blastocatellia bacterium]